jgi:hypothetical protein
MIKIIAAAAVMSLVACSATGAGAAPSAGGLHNPAASGILQIKDRDNHASSGARGRDHARRGGDFRRGRVARGDYGRRRGHGFGGNDWGGGFCTWVGPFQVCP